MERLRPEVIAEMACALADPREFERKVLGLLDQQIGADVGMFLGPQGPTETFGFDTSVLSMMSRRLESVVLELAPMMSAAQRGGGVVVDSEFFGSELKRLVNYNETIMRPNHGRSTLVACPRNQLGPFLCLGRRKGSPDFRARDLARIRGLIPVLTLARSHYLLSEMANRGSTPPPNAAPFISRLTPREREVLSYLHLGYTNQQIGLALGSASRTVRNQLSSIYTKLGVSGRTEAVAVAGAHFPIVTAARR